MLSASLALLSFWAARRAARPSSQAALVKMYYTTPAALEPPTTPSPAETALGGLLAAMHPINFVNKYLVQAMPLSRTVLELAILPCHVYTALGAVCLLGASRETRALLSNLLLYCAWMPLLALAFPDLNSARALSSPLLRQGSILLFYVHHGALLAVPVLLHWRQAVGGRRAALPALVGLAQYLAFIYSFVGVLLCAAALLVGRKYASHSCDSPHTPLMVCIPMLTSLHLTRHLPHCPRAQHQLLAVAAVAAGRRALEAGRHAVPPHDRPALGVRHRAAHAPRGSAGRLWRSQAREPVAQGAFGLTNDDCLL